MISPVWNKGVPQLKTFAQLPTTPITIPQPGHCDEDIIQHEDRSKTSMGERHHFERR